MNPYQNILMTVKSLANNLQQCKSLCAYFLQSIPLKNENTYITIISFPIIKNQILNCPCITFLQYTAFSDDYFTDKLRKNFFRIDRGS